ncbi:MAG: PilZ domain-containing protein [Thermodesulfobacteriota bacterium]
MIRDWTRDFLQRSGVLFQGPAPWGEAACIDAQGSRLLLAPLPGSDAPPLEPGRPAAFQVATAQGFLRVPGTLSGPRVIAINGVPQEVWPFDANPGDMVRINRRAHFRVSVNLKGELRLFSEADARALGAGAALEGTAAAPTHLERLANELSRDRRPCRVWDLGLGGVQLVTTPPQAAPPTAALLDLALGPGETLRNLPGQVVESRPEPDGGEFPLRVRLRFDPLGGAVEARLSRYVTQVQRELLQKGIRG